MFLQCKHLSISTPKTAAIPLNSAYFQIGKISDNFPILRGGNFTSAAVKIGQMSGNFPLLFCGGSFTYAEVNIMVFVFQKPSNHCAPYIPYTGSYFSLSCKYLPPRPSSSQPTMATVQQPYDFVEAITKARRQWNIRVRVVRMWKQPSPKDDHIHGDYLHIIIVDERVPHAICSALNSDVTFTHQTHFYYVHRANGYSRPSNHSTLITSSLDCEI